MKRKSKIITLVICLAIFGFAFSIVPAANALGSHRGSATKYHNVASQGTHVTSAPQYLHHTTNQEDCPYTEDCNCSSTGGNHEYHHGADHQDSQSLGQDQPQTYRYGAHKRQGQSRHYANHEDCPYATE